MRTFIPTANSHYFKTLGDIGHGAHAKLALILCGRNIGYVPEHVANLISTPGALRVIKPEVTRRVSPITAITRPNSPDFKLAERFVDSLVDIHMETMPPKKIADKEVSRPLSLGSSSPPLAPRETATLR